MAEAIIPGQGMVPESLKGLTTGQRYRKASLALWACLCQAALFGAAAAWPRMRHYSQDRAGEGQRDWQQQDGPSGTASGA